MFKVACTVGVGSGSFSAQGSHIDSISVYEGHVDLSASQEGPHVHRTLFLNCSVVIPLESRSAGFDLVGQYFQQQPCVSSWISDTLFATKIGSFLVDCNQLRTIMLSDHMYAFEQLIFDRI